MFLVRNKDGKLEIIARSDLTPNDDLLAIGSRAEMEIVKLKLETDEEKDVG